MQNTKNLQLKYDLLNTIHAVDALYYESIVEAVNEAWPEPSQVNKYDPSSKWPNPGQFNNRFRVSDPNDPVAFSNKANAMPATSVMPAPQAMPQPAPDPKKVTALTVALKEIMVKSPQDGAALVNAIKKNDLVTINKILDKHKQNVIKASYQPNGTIFEEKEIFDSLVKEIYENEKYKDFIPVLESVVNEDFEPDLHQYDNLVEEKVIKLYQEIITEAKKKKTGGFWAGIKDWLGKYGPWALLGALGGGLGFGGAGAAALGATALPLLKAAVKNMGSGGTSAPIDGSMPPAPVANTSTPRTQSNVVRSVNKTTGYDLSTVQFKALALNNIIGWKLNPPLSNSEISQIENGKARLNITDVNNIPYQVSYDASNVVYTLKPLNTPVQAQPPAPAPAAAPRVRKPKPKPSVVTPKPAAQTAPAVAAQMAPSVPTSKRPRRRAVGEAFIKQADKVIAEFDSK